MELHFRPRAFDHLDLERETSRLPRRRKLHIVWSKAELDASLFAPKPTWQVERPTRAEQRITIDARGQKVRTRTTQKARHELRIRSVIEFARRPLLLDHAPVHHHEPISKRHRLYLIVRHIHGRGAQLLVQLTYLDAHLGAQRSIEVRERFVEQEEFGLTSHGSTHGNALTLAAGKLLGKTLEQRLKAEHLRDLCHPFFDHVGRNLAQRKSERDIVAHAHVRIERVRLKHHGDVALARTAARDVAFTDVNGPAIERLEARDNSKQRALAAAARADEHDQLAVLGRDLNTLQHGRRAEGFFDIRQRQTRHIANALARHPPSARLAHDMTRFAQTCLPLIACLAIASCDDGEFRKSFPSESRAPSLSEQAITQLDHLGPTVVDGGVNFGVYSEAATAMELVLFDDPESTDPTARFPLTRFGNVWNVFVEGVGYGQHYGFIAWGPNWEQHEEWFPGSIHGFVTDVDANGNRFNPNKLLIDPYAKALHRDHDWGKGSAASGPARVESTFAAASKGVIVRSDYAWSEAEQGYWENRKDPNFEGHRAQDLIIYEVHAKGLTANTPTGVENPGTYRGVGEMAEYFAELGVTAVEFLPLHEKSLDGGYWGYWTINFFAPEITYSSTEDPLRLLDEFKEMVDRLHSVGIEVIVDVVYNHTGEGGLWRERRYIDDISLDPRLDSTAVEFSPKEIATIQSFRGLDNAAYYGLSEDKQTYWNNTGVGNQTRPNHTPMRRLIVDSLRFYVEELHVDGFRFDLAAVLGEKDLDYNTWDNPANTVLQDIIDDPIMKERNIRMIAEPWSAGGAYFDQVVGGYPVSSDGEAAWGEWNPHYRVWWRSFMNDDAWSLSTVQGTADGGHTMTGSASLFGDDGRAPFHSVNYITAHDGFTMYDLFSFNDKQNKCGMLNRVCCDNPASPWCETDSGSNDNRSRDWGQDQEPFKRQMMRNMFTALMISHGTPMMLGGDEWLRTQYGNNNAYSSGADNEWNWFRWGEWRSSDERHRMFDFVKNIIAFRKAHSDAFTPASYDSIAPMAWKNTQNADKTDWNNRHVMQHYYDRETEIVILINLERGPVTFTLPESRTWKRVLDTQAYFEDQGSGPRSSGNIDLTASDAIPNAEYEVVGSSIVILTADPA